jgi:putative transposase
VFSVSRMCRLLEVSRRGYDEWLGRPPSPQADAARQVQAKVQHYVAQGRGTYGTRRIKYVLAQEGLRVSRRRLGRLLAQAGLRCKKRRKFKAPTAAGQAQTVAPNQLKRAFTVPAPNWKERQGHTCRGFATRSASLPPGFRSCSR